MYFIQFKLDVIAITKIPKARPENMNAIVTKFANKNNDDKRRRTREILFSLTMWEIVTLTSSDKKIILSAFLIFSFSILIKLLRLCQLAEVYFSNSSILMLSGPAIIVPSSISETLSDDRSWIRDSNASSLAKNTILSKSLVNFGNLDSIYNCNIVEIISKKEDVSIISINNMLGVVIFHLSFIILVL
nr:hypothetical protein [Sulfolobus sp. E5-1-F]